MKFQIKSIISLIVLLITFQSNSIAQDRQYIFTPNVGLTIPVLDNGVGFHIGINPAYRITQRLYIEGQLSYSYTDINGSFLSGGKGNDWAVNTLFGPRLYINSEDKKNRFYLNLLAGAVYHTEKRDGRSDDTDFELGYSAGIYYEMGRLMLGLSVDSPGYFVLKVGVRI
ncbi:MAG: acyloxyacyl hydrolase [Saprospiraceae bacterium]